jgi:carbamoyltransferase
VIILGLNAFHADSSATILRDGKLVAAVEEERFRRIKHWAGVPQYSISYCLSEAGCRLSDVDHIAINTHGRANLAAKMKYILSERPELKLILSRLRTREKRKSLPELLSQSFPGQPCKAMVHGVEHHIAHLASAFLVSPFEAATAISMDGFGDFASAAWGMGRGTAISDEGRVYFPHSLGIFYQTMTQYLGFPHYGDEYKLMGLAPYGQPSRIEDMRRIVTLNSDGSFKLNLTFFVHHHQRVDYDWVDGSPQFIDHFSPALEELLGPRRQPSGSLQGRHHDIASSVQAMYEEALFNLLNTLYSRHKLDCIVVAGGCGMNSVANGKIRRMTPFRRVYVQPAAGDAGGAIGAAFSVWHKLGGKRLFEMDHAYWGPEFDSNYIARVLADRQAEVAGSGCVINKISDEGALCRGTAQAIAEGKVVGWFQGRMEWGPRALGNRSIICDPRRADMKAILNAKIKRRESFRPFAPSVLEGDVSAWFEEDDAVPFMMQVFQVREEKRAAIPAVTHVDGSGRLQTVSRRTNPRYYRLIEAFQELTGVPMVLNTSFNENEPVVCTPEEALDCFLRTNMEVLVLGDIVISRKEMARPRTSSEASKIEN